MKSKRILKITFAILVSCAFIASSIFIPVNTAYAATIPNGIGSSKINEIYNDLGKEAKAQLIWHILKKCVKGSYDERFSDFKPSEIKTDDDFFDYSRIGGVVTVPTGYWLENEVQGNGGDDGAIYCRNNNNKILFVAADILGIDYEQILCNGGTPGIIYNKKRDNECDPYSSSDNYRFTDNWESHLEKLWNNAKTKYGWSTSWSNIGYYGGVNGYVIYSLEAGTRCGGSAGIFETASESPSGYHITPALKYVGQDAGKSYQFFKQNNTIEHEFTTTYTFSNCTDLLNRANSDTIITAFTEKVLVTFNDRCKNFYQEEIDSKGDQIDDEAKATFESLKGTSTGYPFLEDKDDPNDPTDTDDKQCVEIDGILHPVQKDEDGSYADEAIEDLNNTLGSTGEGDNCYTNAGSLGWIMCPIIEQLSDAIQKIYDDYITPFLVLDPGLFSDSSGTFDAWAQFRDFANIAFIILFIIVIFSQLTGFGIDNYGVKKILPKLIVAAVMINLSYIICQLCVDIANIVGAGVGGIFEGIAPLNDPTGIYVDGAGGASPTLTSAMAVIVILIIAVTATALLAIGPSVLIPVLMALLSVFLAILFCFVLLAVRKAFAVILVAISPLAFVCYMLPNTKPLYKKWFDAFKAVLIAYPICSAMIYGGQMVSRIIINASNNGASMPFTLAVCAAVIGIVPIFMIPKAIQSSIAMVSGGLVNMQNRLGGWTKGKSRERLNQSRLNDRARYNQQVRQQKMMARTGDYNAKRGSELLAKYERAGKNPGNMKSSERRRYMAAMGAVNARNQEIESSYASSFYGKSDTSIIDQLKAAADSGKIDENMLAAGFSRISDEDNLTKAYNELRGTDGFKKVLADDAARQKVADSLLSRKNSPINQSIGKLMAAGKPINDAAIAEKVQGMGVDAMRNIDKDVFTTAGAASMFSAEQIRAAATAGYTGKVAENFETMMKDVSSKTKEEAVKGMTAEQIASLSAGSLAALGGAKMFDESNANAPTDALNMLRSEAGAELRTKMDAQVMKDLNITNGEKPVGEGGGFTNESGSSSGDFPTSPAQLSDDDISYYNKMKEMSERTSDSEIHIDHGTGTNSATGKPRAAEGNKFDYYPRQKGESNEAYSQRLNRQKMIEEKFQSNPPKEGESNADWMKRVGIPPKD